MSRNKYTVEFRKGVLNYAEKFGFTSTLKKFNITGTMLCTWKKNCGESQRTPISDKHKQEVIKRCKERYYKNRKKRGKAKEYYLLNKERIKKYNQEWYLKSKNNILLKRQNYYRQNKDKIIEQHKDYVSQKYKSDPIFAITMRCRARLYQLLKNGKQDKTFDLIGCTPNQIKEHLESQFVNGMSWENRHKWHIDHIKPCCSFNLTDPQEQRKCFHYTNLQPLWAKDNYKKHTKMDK